MTDPVDHFLTCGIHGILKEDCRVFESWYFDESKQIWTQQHPGKQIVDYKSVEYWVVDGVRYDKYEDAFRAMEEHGLDNYLMYNCILPEFIELLWPDNKIGEEI